MISFAHRLSAVAALLLLSATTSALADNGHWKFTLENKSNKEIVEFRTSDGDDGWSDNWISKRVEPGDTYEMDFNTEEGDCTVRTQIRFTDGGYFDAEIDYCKASTLEVEDEHMVWKGD